MDRNVQRALNRLRSDPNGVLRAARNGSINECTALGNFWNQVPQLISPDTALNAFLPHLDASKVPRGAPDPNPSPPVNLAFVSLNGVSKLGPFLEGNIALIQELVRAWPGIFKWCSFIYSQRVEPVNVPPLALKTSVDMLSSVIYGVGQDDTIREMIVNTPGSIELVVHLWLREDANPGPDMPVAAAGTAALGNLLKYANSALLDRVVRCVGGNAGRFAKLALSRLRDACKPRVPDPSHLTIYTDFINSASRVEDHALRHAFLGSNVIWTVTKMLVLVSSFIKSSNELTYVDCMLSGFGYLSNCLESTDGFTWVLQSLHAGLLTAYVDCSLAFSILEPEDRSIVLRIVKKILPRYLVYRSVIRAVNLAMPKADTTSQRERVKKSVAKDAWNQFFHLALERLLVMDQAKALKGKELVCDNAKCHKMDTRDNFRKCSACLSTYYCSPECQATAWKEGDHSRMCKLKQAERIEGRSESIPKADIAFLHHLSMRDARHHLPQLRTQATRQFPGTPHSGLIITIDYCKIPASFDLKPLEGYDFDDMGAMETGTNAEARTDAILQKVKKDPGNHALIVSRISYGKISQAVLTLATEKFWGSDTGLLGGRSETDDGEWMDEEEDDDSELDEVTTSVDEVDMTLARMALNGFLRSRGQPETF